MREVLRRRIIGAITGCQHAAFDSAVPGREQRLAVLALGLAVLVNLVAIDQPLMGGDDASLFAGIAAGMVKSGDYVQLHSSGLDWLDKPHLPFWLAAASFRLFGITSWAYRLPAFLAIIGAAYYTFRFAARFYGRQVGIWAAAILLTAEHTILSSADVRAEPYLTCFLIAAAWYLVQVAEDRRWLVSAVAAGGFAAAAVMSKGVFAVVPLAGALGVHWLVRGRPPIAWRRWIVVALVGLVGVTPELGALYLQFDRHPEKVIFGRTGVSGIRFFLWDSQFGRFAGTGPIRRSTGSPFFFVHTLLWVFLPWSAVLLLAVARRVRLLWTRQTASVEWYACGGAGLMFAVFSISKFQLPYYLNVIFPFFAILTAAEFAARDTDRDFRVLRRVQLVSVGLMIAAGIAVGWLVRPEGGAWVTIAAVLLAAAVPVAAHGVDSPRVRLLLGAVLGAVAVNLYLARAVWPTLQRYDGSHLAASYVNQRYPDVPVVVPRDHQYTGFNFAVRRSPVFLQHTADTADVTIRPYLMLVPADRRLPPDPRTIRSFDQFPVNRPTLRFLNHRTRSEVLERMDLLLIGTAPLPATPQR